MSYFLDPRGVAMSGLGASWDQYCTGTCEKECVQACDPASTRYDASRCASCKKLYPEYRRAAMIGAVASLITKPGVPAYAAPASGMPSWVLPVGLGVGALVLFMVLKK